MNYSNGGLGLSPEEMGLSKDQMGLTPQNPETKETKREINYSYDIIFSGNVSEITSSILYIQKESNSEVVAIVTVIDGEKGVASATFKIEQKK